VFARASLQPIPCSRNLTAGRSAVQWFIYRIKTIIAQSTMVCFMIGFNRQEGRTYET